MVLTSLGGAPAVSSAANPGMLLSRHGGCAAISGWFPHCCHCVLCHLYSPSQAAPEFPLCAKVAAESKHQGPAAEPRPEVHPCGEPCPISRALGALAPLETQCPSLSLHSRASHDLGGFKSGPGTPTNQSSIDSLPRKTCTPEFPQDQ